MFSADGADRKRNVFSNTVSISEHLYVCVCVEPAAIDGVSVTACMWSEEKKIIKELLLSCDLFQPSSFSRYTHQK